MSTLQSPPASSTTKASEPVRRQRGGENRWTNASLGLAGVLVVIALEELLTRTGVIDPDYLPPFTTILQSLGELLKDPDFWQSFAQTLRGWAIGLALAMIIGVAAGLVIGSVPVLKEFTASTIEFLRPIPSVALIPLVVLMFGTSPQSSIVLVVYAAVWQVLVQVLYGVADVDPVARDTARSYRFSRLTTARTVVWPTALPYVVTGFRLAAAVALVLEVTAELVIGVPGLGRDIGVAQSSNAVAKTYALVIVVGLIGLAINLAARLVERRVLSWHPSVRRFAA
ncbi:ABC-type nitrate/sulfonate/bicarbonate transport system permease component [Branchiibius hedensis]|uniref:ABC-type nitrate/sulfonate/bicarbonate transport system, permease component n=1 Tax=Branchiibius hedensis TaxID=672460 RepID=A0A2Y8ZTD5_9MICO|nr:ABC transporter permease [Branchiibius hedensis]PWJ26839.1 ABC-type nitrate/sulfonate/bicarbonate transport system permease component [Branchiibius hedensis]SSA35650.1 ABC-type nitrate/sulfonate/bicarbonate transport system, permease component [Branchiibius hedensis]